jgi:hypothetical protein
MDEWVWLKRANYKPDKKSPQGKKRGEPAFFEVAFRWGRSFFLYRGFSCDK